MRKRSKDVCVIGIGKLGFSVIKKLYDMQMNVLAIDKDENNLQKVSRLANQIAIADGSDPEVLLSLGVPKFDTVVVGTGENVDIVAALSEVGVSKIIAKAINERHERILSQIGVKAIIRPEIEAGARAALMSVNDRLLEFTHDIRDVGDGYVVAEVWLHNADMVNHEVKNAGFRKLNINIISISRSHKLFLPKGDFVLKDNDKLSLLCKSKDLNHAVETIAKRPEAEEQEK